MTVCCICHGNVVTNWYSQIAVTMMLVGCAGAKFWCFCSDFLF
jgi:hypothetical protein